MSKKSLNKNVTVAKSGSSKTTTRACSNFSKLGPSRGRVFYNSSGGAAPKFQFRTRSVTVVKNTSGSGSLGFEKALRILIFALPVCFFFSYHPVIPLGGDASMNYELSVPLLWLVVFDVVGFAGLMWRRRLFGRMGWVEELKRKWLWVLFPVWLTLSVIWSLNHMRGFLTVGILWLIYLAGYVMWSFREVFDGKIWQRWVRWFLGASLVVCGWCILQCILDLVGAPRENSLMCAGCTYRMFGFPHPNGFAIEPQFMGNLLLAPAILSAWIMMKKRIFGSDFLDSKFLLLCFFIIVTTLFLTFSRGAIYAFVVGMLFLSGFLVFCVKKKMRSGVLRRVGLVWGVVVVSFLFDLSLLGFMAVASPTNDTFRSGVAKVINHLSLGTIEIRGEGGGRVDGSVEGAEDADAQMEVVAEDGGLKDGKMVDFDDGGLGGGANNDSEESDKSGATEGGEGKNTEVAEAVFDGYVEESTNTRLRLNEAAIRVWSKDAKNMLFGVGIGGAGRALYEDDLSPAPKEIIQNEYLSILLETGVIGVVLAILTLVLLVRVAARSRGAGMILALIVAYGVSLMFFSGLPNALHIYLLLVLFSIVRFETKEPKREMRV